MMKAETGKRQNIFAAVSIIYFIVQMLLFQEYLLGWGTGEIMRGIVMVLVCLVLQHYTNYILLLTSSLIRAATAKLVLDGIGLAVNIVCIPMNWFTAMFLSAEGSHHYACLNWLVGVYASFIVVYIIKLVTDIVEVRKKAPAGKDVPLAE